MNFTSFEFGAFFIFVFIFSWEMDCLPTPRKIFLLLASIGFYASLDIQFLPLLLFSAVLNFVVGQGLEWLKSKNKDSFYLLAVGVGLHLMNLFYFKYKNFFLESLQSFAELMNLKIRLGYAIHGAWTLPLGISFFTFQGISYLVDIHRKKLSGKQSILDVVLFICFFPHLIAGPIVKAHEFIPQLSKNVRRDRIPFFWASSLIIWGLFKKLVIANTLAVQVVDPFFENPSEYKGIYAIFAVYAYAVQIYCDFSGYSDLAISFAALLGYEFPENFNQPYRSSSIQEFWRRWHISLSTWLKEYLYIPLGGNREGEVKTYINLAITMILGGLWHGASWNFLFWGFLHGFGLGVERYVQLAQYNTLEFWSKVPKYIRQTLMQFTVFNFVCFAWIFFRSPDWTTSFEVINSIFQKSQNLNSTHILELKISLWCSFLVILGLASHFLPKWPSQKANGLELAMPAWLSVVFLCFGFLLINFLCLDGLAPFIYFRF